MHNAPVILLIGIIALPVVLVAVLLWVNLRPPRPGPHHQGPHRLRLLTLEGRLHMAQGAVGR